MLAVVTIAVAAAAATGEAAVAAAAATGEAVVATAAATNESVTRFPTTIYQS